MPVLDDQETPLDQQGAEPLSPSETAALDQIEAGLNHSSGNRQSLGSRLRGMASKNKRGLALGGGLAGLIAALVAGLFALLPLKLEMMMKNFEQRYFARAETSLENRVDKHFEYYIDKKIGQEVDFGGVGANGLVTGNLARDTFHAWQAAKIEKQISDHQGITFSRGKTGGVKLTKRGVGEFEGTFTFDNLSNSELRAAIKDAVNEETQPHQIVKRRHLRQLLMKKYKVPKWHFFDPISNIQSKIQEAKVALKKQLVEYTIRPLSDKWADWLGCIIENGHALCKNFESDPATPAEDAAPPTPETPPSPDTTAEDLAKQKASQAEIDQAKTVKGYAQDQVGQAFTNDAVNQAESHIVGEESGQTLRNTVLEVLQEQLLNKITTAGVFGVGVMELVDKIDQAFVPDGGGPSKIDAIITDRNKQQYSSFYAGWATLNSQLKANKMDENQVSAAMEQLDGIEQSRVWSTENGFSFDPKYEKCGDSKTPLDSSELVCGDKMIKSNKYKDFWENTEPFATFHQVASAYHDTVHKGVSLINGVLGVVSNVIKPVLQPIISAILNFTNLQALIDAGMQKVMGFAFGPIISGTETGKDLYNAVDAGADVTSNDEAHYDLGGKKLTQQEAQQISDSLVQQKTEIAKAKGWQYRVFAVSNVDSLISKLIIALPFGPKSAVIGFSHYVTHPIASIFSPDHLTALFAPKTYADNTNNVCSYFGNDCYGWPVGSDQFAVGQYDPDSQQCAQIEKDWEKQLDSGKGENTTTNPCRLERTSLEVSKSMFTTDDDGGVNSGSGNDTFGLSPGAGCANPFTDPGWGLSRTDQGVDYTSSKPLPVRAICDGTVLSTKTPGWPGAGAFIYVKIDDKDPVPSQVRGKCYYIAENLTNLPQINQHVTAGQVIATTIPGDPNTEWGWAQGPGTPATPATSYDHNNTEGGLAFARFIRSLGGTTQWDPGDGPIYTGASCP